MLPILTITDNKRPASAYTYAQLCAELNTAIWNGSNSRPPPKTGRWTPKPDDFKHALELTNVALYRGWHEMATELMNEAMHNEYKHPLIRAMIKEGVVPNVDSLMILVTDDSFETDDLLKFILEQGKVVPTIEVLKAAEENRSLDSWRDIDRNGYVEKAMPPDELKRYRQAEEEEWQRYYEKIIKD